jgi:hypothetical protein
LHLHKGVLRRKLTLVPGDWQPLLFASGADQPYN